MKCNFIALFVKVFIKKWWRAQEENSYSNEEFKKFGYYKKIISIEGDK